MKKILFLLMVLTFAASISFGAMTYTITGTPTGDWWTGQTPNFDPAWAWAKEVEDRIEFTQATGAFWFNPTDTAPTASEGMTYYNDTTNALRYYNGSAWITVGTSAGGDSLDTAYDNGNKIDVDGDVLELEVDDGSNNVALLIDHDEATNDNDAMQITNAADAGTAVSIQIDGTAGYDIQGTGDVWNISTAGAATLVGITNTGEITSTTSDVLFDDTYDLSWDTSRDQLLFEDNAVLGFGGAHDAAGDVTFSWNATNLLVESAAEDTGEIEVGATNAIDLVLHANTAASEVAFNANTATAELNGYDIQLMDDDVLAFGDSDEFTIEYNEDNADELAIVALNANDRVQIGTAAANTDFRMQGTTASTYAEFDASADEMVFDLADLKISQGSQIEFIDVTDSLVDWTIDNATDETLLIYPTETTDDQSVNLGNATNTTDLRIFGKTASTVVFDASADEVLFDAYDIALGDGDELLFGDTLGTGDFTISDATDVLLINNVADGTGTVAFGASNAGIDVAFYGDAGAASMLWDENANTNGALIFNVCDIEMGDGDFIQLGDGADLTASATGTTTTITMAAGSDLDILDTDNAASKIIFGLAGGTHGLDLQINSITANDDIIFDAASKTVTFDDIDLLFKTGAVINGDGTTELVGTVADVVTDIDNETLTVAESGTVFDNTADGDGTIFTLPEASTAIGVSYTFVVVAAQALNINPGAANDRFIAPITNAVGDSIESSTAGDSVTILCIGDDSWVITAAYPAATDWPDSD